MTSLYRTEAGKAPGELLGAAGVGKGGPWSGGGKYQFLFFKYFLLWFSELQVDLVVKDRLQGSGVLHMGSRLPLSGKHTLGVASPGEGSKARVSISDGGCCCLCRRV